MLTYVSVVAWGHGCNIGQDTLYAGSDKTEAIKQLTVYIFPDNTNNRGWVEIWENGRLIRQEYIR